MDIYLFMKKSWYLYVIVNYIVLGTTYKYVIKLINKINVLLLFTNIYNSILKIYNEMFSILKITTNKYSQAYIQYIFCHYNVVLNILSNVCGCLTYKKKKKLLHLQMLR